MEPLLFLSHRIPYPPNKGDKVRSYHLLAFLAQRFRVFLGTFIDDPADTAHVDAVKGLCAGVCAVRMRPPLARLRGLQGLVTGAPLSVRCYRDRGLARWVADTVVRHRIRKALVFSSVMAQYVEGIDDIRAVVDFVDVDSDKWRQYASRHPWPVSMLYAREARTLLRFERSVARVSAHSVFVTPEEAKLFASLAPDVDRERIVAIGNGVDAGYFTPEPQRRSPFPSDEEAIVFTGAMDYWPNVDAAAWFAAEVLPRIAAARPAARFYVVGMNPAPAVRALARAGSVVVTGRVADVRPFLQHARVVVAPLRVARGIQNKVLEAMAMGRPVVASRACAGALSAVPGVELEVAGCAEEFAATTVRLLRDSRQEQLGPAARSRVLADYSWEANLSRLEALLRGQFRPHASASHRQSDTRDGVPAAAESLRGS